MRGVVLAVALAMAGAAWAQTAGLAPGPVASVGGHFRVIAQSAVQPVVINKIHSWTLTLTDAAGAPVDGASLAIDASVPIIERVTPTAPRVTRALGEGRYLVEGMKFDMAGRWRLQIAIRSGNDSDHVVMNVDVK